MAWKRGWKMVSRNPKRFKRVWLRVPDAVKPIRKYGPNGTVGPAVRFTWSETQSGDGEMPKGVIKTNVVHQARLLNVLRKNIAKHYKVSFADVSINVNSWYRSPSYNKKIGGAQFSQHMLGKATDITVTVQGRRLIGLAGERLIIGRAGLLVPAEMQQNHGPAVDDAGFTRAHRHIAIGQRLFQIGNQVTQWAGKVRLSQ